MYKSFKLFFLFFFVPLLLIAQITPKEGSALNYRIIGFSFPPVTQISDYELQIAAGNYSNESSFQKNIAVTANAKNNKIIAEVPAFGRQYTWRIGYSDERSKKTYSELHHFNTMVSPDVNPDSVRLRIISDQGKYKDDYVFVDCNKVLYDMQGHPVWFFPKIGDINTNGMHLRDLKLSPFGTITAIIDERIYEINYNGAILWQGRGNDKITKDSTLLEVYHHEFTRLSNGHYMVMAFEQVLWQLPVKLDSETYKYIFGKIKRNNSADSQKMMFGTILEYDREGNIVWKWSGSDYFKTSDLSKRMFSNGLFNLNDTHANAFYFDDKSQTICISFRDINRIIKIQYPSGKVLATYGKFYTPGNERDRHLVNGLFCGQHSSRLSSEGNLYLFNNNICHRKSVPTVLMLKEPHTEKDTLEKIWEFECPIEVQNETERSPVTFNFGGNVFELPGNAFFVCMGGTYGKLFIVNRDKQVLWSGQPEKWDKDANRWIKEGFSMGNGMREGSYRSSIITRSDLESMIWNEPLKK